ncbi:hypothetical protein BHE74_00008472 [Ensete ventricosum]|nr:hypothetical protein BHE74_00008472 [Ensete ventricosum]
MWIAQVSSISANWITFLPINTKHRRNTSGLSADGGTNFETRNTKTKGQGLVSPPSSSPYILPLPCAANACAALSVGAVSSSRSAGLEVDVREPDRLDRPSDDSGDAEPFFFRSVYQCANVLVSVMGKVEGQGESWHGHVTAVTVSSEYRRQKIAKKLMHLLEHISDKM